MKLSSKSWYGVRLMTALASAGREQPLSLRQAAQQLEISPKYLEQIVSALTKNGLLTGIRGTQGGYLLSEPPQSIRLGDIIRATDGCILSADCPQKDKERSESLASDCGWRQFFHAVEAAADSITLADMIKERDK